jgi:formylmethanofuran dehydrogenase subunit E
MNAQSWNKLNYMLNKCKVKHEIKSYIRECVKFHGFPAAGLLISIFMVDLALEKLEMSRDEKMYAVSETPKCAPDALQVITHCTVGNHGLRIINTGRFAITINKQTHEAKAEGVRVYIDATKARNYPILFAWYTNDPKYKERVDAPMLLTEILNAGTNILSWEYVEVHVPKKEKWSSVMCSCCGELVPEHTIQNGLCQACNKNSYYDKRSKFEE